MRFEGLAGEFSQHDFGHVDVGFLNGTEKRVHFFASRLKYSRWVEVTLVPDERSETLVRAFVDHLAAVGGVPLLAVFDRPKTIALKWTRDGHVTDWNPLFAGVALDLSVGIEVCWPAAPWQKAYASVAGRFAVTHERKFQPGEGSLLPEHRADHVAAVSGKRAKCYLQREHLLKRGPTHWRT